MPNDFSGQVFRGLAKHFVMLTYRVKLRGRAEYEPGAAIASCFVVQIDDLWCLVTAGHVINKIEELRNAGHEPGEFHLWDEHAGHTYPWGIPYAFEAGEWIVIEGVPEGTDYAITPLDDLSARQLHSGGVRPLREGNWGDPPYEVFRDWLLIGVPQESYTRIDASEQVNLKMIPIVPVERPEAVREPPGDKVYARLKDEAEKDGRVDVDSVFGMSGGPIFGVNKVDEGGRITIHYQVIGIQSSWIQGKRTVGFCPAAVFLAGIRDAFRKFRNQPT